MLKVVHLSNTPIKSHNIMNLHHHLLTHSVFPIRLRLIAVCFLLFIGCDAQKPLPPVSPQPPIRSKSAGYTPADVGKKKVILVLVDLTTQGEDDAHIAELSHKVGQIIESAPFDSKISIYPVDRSPYVPPILEFAAPPQPRNATQRKRAKRSLEAYRDSAMQSILGLFESVYLPASTQPTSCLVRSLSRAHSIFARFENSGEIDRELILLSDMVEECNYEGFGLVSMSRQHNTFADFFKQYRPNYDLGYADVSIVMSTQQHLSQSHGVPIDTLAGYWRQVFQKIGFSAEQVAGLVLNTRLPEKYLPSEARWN